MKCFRMNKVYLTPVTDVSEIDPQGILCESPIKGIIEDVEREEFSW